MNRRPSICLNMILKDEAHVIRRCLNSVRSIVDCWVIVDTGSTDGTQAIVREHLADLPGELIERPWVDFAHNRTEALAYARDRADYIFVIDADEILDIAEGFEMPQLTADFYTVEVCYGDYTYLRKQLVRSALAWRYRGVVHEYITCDEAQPGQLLAGLRTIPYHEGARSRDPHTYHRDALLLEKALLDEPQNARYVFYLAQSYRDAGDLELALRHYKRRAAMNGWSEEVWFALYQIAQIKQLMNAPWAEIMEDYLAAYQYQPKRSEPLYRIGAHFLARGEYHAAQLFFDRAMQIPSPNSEALFVERSIYDYLLPLEYAVTCHYVGHYDEAIDINNKLLSQAALPPRAFLQIIKNRRYSLDALFPKSGPPAARVGSMIVCVPFRDPGPEMDDCIESLLRQTLNAVRAVFIDDGSKEDHAPRIPLDNPRFSLIRHGTPLGWDQCVDRFIAEHCCPDDVVVLLSPGDCLADYDVLTNLHAAFNDGGCKVLYGQYRLASGKQGHAEPAPTELAFIERGAALLSRSAICFRAQLRDEAHLATLGHANRSSWDIASATPEKSILVEALLRAAGFKHTRFSDSVVTVTREPASEGPPRTRIRPSDRSYSRMTARSKDDVSWPHNLAAPPLISCLMATRDRLALAKRAIRCFVAQTYPNRELVIVTDGDVRYRQALERFVAEIASNQIRFVYPDRKPITLGYARNASLEAAAGEILCQWDDDDCSHPDRLMVQATHMLKARARACCLTDHFQFLEDSRALAWVDWTLGGKSGDDQLLPGTIMMFKDDRFRYPESGPYALRGEDSAFLSTVCAAVPVAPLRGKGYLYLYTYHGRNTFPKEHHYRLSMFSLAVSDLRQREEAIRKAMMYYPVAKPFVVIGRDGPAFVLNE